MTNLALIADLGTSHMKVGVVDPSGRLLATESRSIGLQRPETGAVEHDPQELFDHFAALCRTVSQGYAEQIAVLGLSGYQFGFMPMDASGQPLTGMITLLDTRSTCLMPQLEQEWPYEEIYERTGCPPFSTYSLARLAWLQRAKPEVFKQSAWFADLKSYLLHRLCGKRYTEPSMASAFQLFDIEKGNWDEELLALAGITNAQLPDVVKSEKVVATLSAKAAGLLGLSPGVPIVPGVYDGGALILGLGGYGGEVGVCNLGTTGMLRTCSPEIRMDDPKKRRLQTYALVQDRWAYGAALNNAGLAMRWFKGVAASTRDYAALNELAGGVAPGSDGLFFLPFLSGERDPRIGSLATASFFGLKEHHTLGHMTRAVMEGVGFGLNLIKAVMEERGVELREIRLGGGGSRSPLWPQILADIFDVPVAKSVTDDAVCTGGAIVAFTAIGEYGSIAEASRAMTKTETPIPPLPENVEAYREGFAFYEDLIERFRDLYDQHTRRFGNE